MGCGGTLMVTDLGGTLVASCTFTLFSAAGCNGSFSSVNLRLITCPFVWCTSGLNTNGASNVVVAAMPLIGRIELDGTNIVITGVVWGHDEQNLYGAEFKDSGPAIAQGTRITTNGFDGTGSFVFAKALDLAKPQRFCLVRVW